MASRSPQIYPGNTAAIIADFEAAIHETVIFDPVAVAFATGTTIRFNNSYLVNKVVVAFSRDRARLGVDLQSM